jgi:hypothetical protein
MSYIIETNGYVHPHEIDGRISELIKEIAVVVTYSEEIQEARKELAALRAFKDEVIGRVGDWTSAIIVPAADFEDHARDYAEDHVEGLDLIDGYVNWAGFANNLIDDYAAIETADGDRYLAR